MSDRLDIGLTAAQQRVVLLLADGASTKHVGMSFAFNGGEWIYVHPATVRPLIINGIMEYADHKPRLTKAGQDVAATLKAGGSDGSK